MLMDYGWQWSSEYPVLLGVDTNPASNQLTDILIKGKQVLKNWYYRTLTLTGKINIVNTLFASLFVYVLQVIDNPSSQFYVDFYSIVNDFLWRGKKSKIPLAQLQLSKSKGGLK